VTYNYVQYTLVELTNLQAGIQVIVTYLATAVGVKVFQVVFLNKNWRTTLYLSMGLMQVMGLLWLLVYWDEFGLMDPWFTIFVTVGAVSVATPSPTHLTPLFACPNALTPPSHLIFPSSLVFFSQRSTKPSHSNS
jgi:hypothetical protein